MTDFSELQAETWEIAETHGFHEGPEEGVDERSRAKVLALIHSEVSEALEADRNNEGIEAYSEELADIVIRVMDHAACEDMDLETVIEEKMEKNRQREYKHGKEY